MKAPKNILNIIRFLIWLLPVSLIVGMQDEWKPRLPKSSEQAKKEVSSLKEEIAAKETELEKLRKEKQEGSQEYREAERLFVEKKIDLESAEIADAYFSNKIDKSTYDARKKEIEGKPKKLIEKALKTYTSEIESDTNPSSTANDTSAGQELSRIEKLKLQVLAFFADKQAEIFDFFNNKEKVSLITRNLIEIYTTLNDPKSIAAVIDRYGMNTLTLIFMLKRSSNALEKIAADTALLDNQKAASEISSILVEIIRLREYAQGSDETSRKIRQWIDDTLTQFNNTFDLPQELTQTIQKTVAQPTIPELKISPSTSIDTISLQIKQFIDKNVREIDDRIGYLNRSIEPYINNLEQFAINIQDYAQNPTLQLSKATHLKLNKLTDKIYESLYNAAKKRYDGFFVKEQEQKFLTKEEEQQMKIYGEKMWIYKGKRLSVERQVTLAEDRVLAAQEFNQKIAESIKAQIDLLEKKYASLPNLSENSQKAIKKAIESAAEPLIDILLGKKVATPQELQNAFTYFREMLEGYRAVVAHMPSTSQEIVQLGKDISVVGIHLWQMSLEAFNSELPETSLKIINDALDPLEKVILELNALNNYHFNQLTPVVRGVDGSYVTTLLEKTILDHPYANTTANKTSSVKLNQIINDIRVRAADDISNQPDAFKPGNAQRLVEQLSPDAQKEVQILLSLPTIKLPTDLIKNISQEGSA